MSDELHMKDVWRLYDQYAAEFARHRTQLIGEETYLQAAMAATGVANPSVLDLGCGSGAPIAQFLIASGCAVTGVDAAPALLTICRKRFPQGRWLEHDMRSLALPERFDMVVAWDSFFHLPHDDQRAMFKVFAQHCKPRGALLFTSGHYEGIALGRFHGQELYHASLSEAEYRQLLDRFGFEVLLYRAQDPACGHHTVWLAHSRGS